MSIYTPSWNKALIGAQKKYKQVVNDPPGVRPAMLLGEKMAFPLGFFFGQRSNSTYRRRYHDLASWEEKTNKSMASINKGYLLATRPGKEGKKWGLNVLN